MKSVEVEVRNPSGIHARPAATFVKAAAAFTSRISLENLTRGRAPANAKSMLTVLTQAASKGNRVRIVAEGDDEEEAVAALKALIESGLGETLED